MDILCDPFWLFCRLIIIAKNIKFTDTILPTVDLKIPENRKNLWKKTRAAFKYVYENHWYVFRNYWKLNLFQTIYKMIYFREDGDWFLKADDDTYMIIENLKYMLHQYNSFDPWYFGCKFKKFVKVFWNLIVLKFGPLHLIIDFWMPQYF